MQETKRKEKKSAAAIPLVAYWGGNYEGIPNRNAVASWYDAWRQNGDVFRAVKIISDTAAKSGFKVYRNGEEYSDAVTDALIDSFKKVKRTFILHSTVGGTGYLAKQRNGQEFGGSTVGFKVLDTRKVQIVASSNTGEIVAYKATDATRPGVMLTYRPEDVLKYVPTEDPNMPHVGISPIAAVLFDALSDDRAAMSNFVFFDNDATPASIVRVKDGVTPDGAKKMEEWLKLKNGGAKNKNRTVVLQGVEDIVKLSNDSDGKYSGLRKESTEKVCAALGVPKSVLNYTDGVTYSNASAQYTAFIENTVRPLEHDIEELLEQALAEYGEGFEVEVVDNHVDDLEARQKIALANVNAGIVTRNEAREEMGMEPVDNPALDEYAVGSNPIAVSAPQA